MKREKRIISGIYIVLLIVFISATIVVYQYQQQVRPAGAGAGDGTIGITGSVHRTISLADLKELKSVTIPAELRSSGHPKDQGRFNYTGVFVRDLLKELEIADYQLVIVTASDGYCMGLSRRDIEEGDALLAYEMDGSPLKSKEEGGYGPVRLILPHDFWAQRWVKWVNGIEIR
jgi:DMSO/TMAO reductase YedYZ molybdopterin-dependent catalytic subunit